MTQTHVNLPEFLRSPVACALLLLIQRENLPVGQAVRPPLAWELAAQALHTLDPWTGYQMAALEEVRNRAAHLTDLAQEVLDHPDTAWWSAPMDRYKQVWLGSSRGERRHVDVPEAESRTSQYAQRPERWFFTSTSSGQLTALHALIAYQGGDWDPEFPLPQASLRVSPEARIFEINGPRDWHHLCVRYGSTKEINDRQGTTSELVPNWAAVAQDWEGVHLSFGGFLTATFVDQASSAGNSRLWTWESESTLWLRHVFDQWEEQAELLERPKTLAEIRTLDLDAEEQLDSQARSRARLMSKGKWTKVLRRKI